MRPERTETTRKIHHGFTLTEQEIRRICTILTQQMNIAVLHNKFVSTFRLKFKNQIAVERNSVEDILTESNGGPWMIQSLEIELYDDSRCHLESCVKERSKQEGKNARRAQGLPMI